MGSKVERQFGLDAMRLPLAFAVVMLHALPRSSLRGTPDWAVIAACMCRGAVPFFLILAGYFLRTDRETRQLIIGPIKGLLPLYVFWFAVYAAVRWVRGGHLLLTPRDLVTGGAGLHLWFLPALIFGLCAVGAGIRLIGLKWSGVLCGLAAGVGLAIGGYNGVLGLPDMPAQRLLVAPVFVFSGYVLARWGVRVGLAAAATTAIVALAALVAEEWLVGRASGQPAVSHDFMLSTLPYGIGLFLVAKELPLGAVTRGLAGPGRLALGIYASHLLFVWLLAPILGKQSLGVCLLIATGAFAGAVALSYALSLSKWTRQFVAR
jgi:surface polysaccharide O-acyltransferase-like enzyme